MNKKEFRKKIYNTMGILGVDDDTLISMDINGEQQKASVLFYGMGNKIVPVVEIDVENAYISQISATALLPFDEKKYDAFVLASIDGQIMVEKDQNAMIISVNHGSDIEIDQLVRHSELIDNAIRDLENVIDEVNDNSLAMTV